MERCKLAQGCSDRPDLGGPFRVFADSWELGASPTFTAHKFRPTQMKGHGLSGIPKPYRALSLARFGDVALLPRRIYSSAAKDRFNPATAPSSKKHHDIESFQEYARRANLGTGTPVYVGTLYEYTVASSLRRLGFDLHRTGRSSDQGIDLLGRWTVDGFSEPLRVIVQCKALNRSLDPKHVRELEGAFTGVPTEWRKENVIGLLATTNKATKGVTEALGRSRWPMGFLKVSTCGTVEQFLWNQTAIERGLEGLGVATRYSEGMAGGDDKSPGVQTDVVLTWMGRPVLPGGSEGK